MSTPKRRCPCGEPARIWSSGGWHCDECDQERMRRQADFSDGRDRFGEEPGDTRRPTDSEGW